MPDNDQVDMSQVNRIVSSPDRTLRIEVPSRSTPGFLRREKRHQSIMARLNGETPDPGAIDELCEFVADMTVEPVDRNEAIELILDLSMEDYYQIMKQIGEAQSAQNPIQKPNGKS